MHFSTTPQAKLNSKNEGRHWKEIFTRNWQMKETEILGKDEERRGREYGVISWRHINRAAEQDVDISSVEIWEMGPNRCPRPLHRERRDGIDPMNGRRKRGKLPDEGERMVFLCNILVSRPLISSGRIAVGDREQDSTNMPHFYGEANGLKGSPLRALSVNRL
jgi:hypothetical protein